MVSYHSNVCRPIKRLLYDRELFRNTRCVPPPYRTRKCVSRNTCREWFVRSFGLLAQLLSGARKKRLPRMTVKSWRKGRIKNGSITAVIDIERNFFLKASFGLMQLHTPAGARDILSNLSDTFFVLFKHASPR